ncbi:MAG TPA: radical SAM protein [Peptococcaceae bacterium]|nr:MAG: Radical SAM domain protein [Clostridia bacterium 41_269]HBT20343.1 radical SAM protein [Peptococcaceae bacterium]
MPETAVSVTYCKTALVKTGIPGYRFCLNPYVGCSHGCRYCYADTVLRFSGCSEKWGEFATAKINFPEVLRHELTRKRSFEGKIIVGTVTDAYQPAEKKFGLTRKSLETIADLWPHAELDLLTKSHLVVRDVDVLKKLKNCSIGFTITLRDDDVASVLEPGAAAPSKRFSAAEKLAAEGIKVWAFIAPVLPGLTDAPGVLENIVLDLKEAGVEEIYFDSLNPYPASIQRLKAVYRENFPGAQKHLEYYLSSPKGYLKRLFQELASLSKKTGLSLRMG